MQVEVVLLAVVVEDDLDGPVLVAQPLRELEGEQHRHLIVLSVASVEVARDGAAEVLQRGLLRDDEVLIMKVQSYGGRMEGWRSVRGNPFVGAARREGHAGQGDCGVRVHSVAAGSVVAGEVRSYLLLSMAQSRSSARATMPSMTTTSQAAPRPCVGCVMSAGARPPAGDAPARTWAPCCSPPRGAKSALGAAIS